MIPRVLASVVLSLAAAAVAAAPLLLQQPFGSQTPARMAIAHAMKRFGSPLTVVLAVATIWLALRVAADARRWLRPLLVVPVAIVLAAAWFARQNPFEWWFNALAAPRFVSVRDASLVEPQDLVLAVSRDGDAAAFPIRLLAYHHIVNERIGQSPAVVTY